MEVTPGSGHCPVSSTGSVIPAIEPEHSNSSPEGRLRPAHGDMDMARYTDLALRLAAIAAFVLVLAAPFRWQV